MEGGKGGRDRRGEREGKRREGGRGRKEREREMAVRPSLLIITLNVKELNLPIKK